MYIYLDRYLLSRGYVTFLAPVSTPTRRHASRRQHLESLSSCGGAPRGGAARGPARSLQTAGRGDCARRRRHGGRGARPHPPRVDGRGPRQQGALVIVLHSTECLQRVRGWSGRLCSGGGGGTRRGSDAPGPGETYPLRQYTFFFYRAAPHSAPLRPAPSCMAVFTFARALAHQIGHGACQWGRHIGRDRISYLPRERSARL